MSISGYRNTELTCGTCGDPFTTKAWVIIDAQERPDLWAACIDGTIHHARCPQRHHNAFDAELLLHDGARALVVFSPPEGAALPAPACPTACCNSSVPSLLSKTGCISGGW
jgi:hypothetical protein